MAYNNFSLDMLIHQFGLQIVSASHTFAQAAPVAASTLLMETLADFMPLALQIGTEKSRSEFIIAPVLADAWRKLKGAVSLFSGVDFTVDADVGLSGVCDYLFSLTPLQLVVQAPVVAVVEAKNDNIKTGLGQCMAEMLAAQRFNDRRGLPLPRIYGVVTSGSAWKFMSLQDTTVTVDEAEYHIEQLDTILGILVFMVREALDQQGKVIE